MMSPASGRRRRARAAREYLPPTIAATRGAPQAGRGDEGHMTDALIGRWADLLVDYCLRVAPGETILIASELEARPLVEACYRAVVRRGAHPLVRLELPGLAEFFVTHATEAQLEHLPPVALHE